MTPKMMPLWSGDGIVMVSVGVEEAFLISGVVIDGDDKGLGDEKEEEEEEVVGAEGEEGERRN